MTSTPSLVNGVNHHMESTSQISSSVTPSEPSEPELESSTRDKDRERRPRAGDYVRKARDGNLVWRCNKIKRDFPNRRDCDYCGSSCPDRYVTPNHCRFVRAEFTDESSSEEEEEEEEIDVESKDKTDHNHEVQIEQGNLEDQNDVENDQNHEMQIEQENLEDQNNEENEENNDEEKAENKEGEYEEGIEEEEMRDVEDVLFDIWFEEAEEYPPIFDGNSEADTD